MKNPHNSRTKYAVYTKRRIFLLNFKTKERLMKNSRKFFIIVLVSILAGLFVFTANAQNAEEIEAVFGKTKFTLNGEPLAQDSLLYDGTAYLPAAYFARAVGLEAKWDAKSNITHLSYSFKAPETTAGKTLKEPQTKRIEVTFGSPVYYLNGVPLEKESLTYNGTAYLPASYLAEAIGLNPVWNPETNITDISFTPVSNIEFPGDEIIADIYADIQLEPDIYPADADFKQLRYTSSNENIAVVSDTGRVFAQNEGEAVITCTAVNGVSTSFKITVSVPAADLPGYAEGVVHLVNEERQKAGLAPLSYDYQNLTDCAFVRAEELIQLFSHTRPDGTSCFTAFDEFGVDYMAAGENIAVSQQTPEDVVKAWMNSPGHRANILSESFTAIGVGVAEDANGRLYWVQMFIG
jgi:uncharacterized protein YkwD